MNTIKIDTYLPLFSGFYGTLFEPCEDDEICYINELRQEKNKKPINYDDCVFDYREREKNISIEACEFIEHELKEFITNIKFQKLISPKFYNYSNDSINCEITVNIDKIFRYLDKHKKEFTEYLKVNYTSCSGFISSYDNFLNSNDWKKETVINSGHQIGSILNFICINEDITEMDLYEGIEHTYITCENFNELTE